MAIGHTGMVWVTESVQEKRDVGSWSSIMVGSDGVLHVSYYDTTWHNLMYAQKRDRRWVRVSLGGGRSRGDEGGQNALAVDSRNEPHIAYFDATGEKLLYVFHSDLGSSLDHWWVSPLWEDIPSAGAPSLALGAANQFHILHHSGVGGHFLKYLTQSLETRHVDVYGTVISRRAFGGSSALALDGNGKAHVVYNDYCPLPECDEGEVSEWIVYATNATRDGQWAKTPIVHVPGSAAANRVDKPSIVVDGQGVVHIIYADREDGALKYLANAGDWALQVLYDATWVSGASMVMEAGGVLHVSFTAGAASGGTTLMYATNASGAWGTETVAGGGRIGKVTSIAVDRFGQPHISYYDATNGDLRLAVRIRSVIESLPGDR